MGPLQKAYKQAQHNQRHKREVTIVNSQIAQLYNFCQIHKLAGQPETPFKQWLLVKTLAKYYDRRTSTNSIPSIGQKSTNWHKCTP